MRRVLVTYSDAALRSRPDRRRVFAAFLAAGVSLLLAHNLHAAETTLVADSATWRYLADGSDQGTAWRAPAFDDSAWSNGVAQLGFGGNGEVTTIPSGPVGDRHITTYFRHDFALADAADVTALTVELLRDDGAAVYINGSNVWMSNVSAPLHYEKLADTAMGGAAETEWHTQGISPAVLTDGTNVVAVEVHQASSSSSDLGFDLSLKAETTEPTFVVEVASPYGSPTPPVGSNLVVTGAVLHFSMPVPTVEQGSTQFVCTGWTGTGSIPSGTGTSSQVVINTNSAIAWHWSTNTWLTATASAGGTVAGGNTWTPVGGTNIIAALAEEYAVFSHWEGDTTGLNTNQAVLTVAANPARSLHAVFEDTSDAVGLPDQPVVEFETSSLLDRYAVSIQTNALSGLSTSNMPAGLCYNAAGDMVLVLQAAPPAIRYYSTNGVHLGNTTQLDGFDTPRELARAVGATNRYAIGDVASRDVCLVTLTTGTVSVAKSGGAVLSLANMASNTLRDIAYDAVNDGLYMLLDTPSGSRVSWASTSSTGTVDALTVFTPSGLSEPDGLVRDPWSGSHIVANADGLSRWDHTGALQETRAGVLPASATLALTPDGRELAMLGNDASLTTAGLAPPVKPGPEGTAARLFVTLSRAHSQWVGVPYTTVSETAEAGDDFSPTAGTVWVRPGRTRARFDIQRLTDAVAEDEERLHVHLGTPSSASLGRDTTHTVAIESNDLVTVVVASPYGSPTPSVGTNEFPEGTVVTFRMDDAAIPLGVDTQRMCSGWSGTGSIPAGGSGTEFTQSITTDSTITWLWETGVLVSATNTIGGRVFGGDAWVPLGSTHRIDVLAFRDYRFTAWTGDVSPALTNSRPLMLPADRSRSITGVFAVVTVDGKDIPPTARFDPPPITRYGAPTTNVALGGPWMLNFSGVAYIEASAELYIVANYTELIQVYDTNGSYRRQITLPGFDDTEGICAYDAVSNGVAILEEASGDITLAVVTTTTTSIARWNWPTIDTGLDWLADPNKGSEGIVYDRTNDCFFIVKEKNPLAVHVVFVDTNSATANVYPLFDATAKLGTTITDMSDVWHDPNRDRLFILSDESHAVLECDFSGNILGQHPLTATQPEGLVATPDGTTLFVIGEPNEYFRYQLPPPGSTCTEGTGQTVTLRLSRALTTPVTASLLATNGDAEADVDFDLAPTNVIFAAGAITGAVEVAVVLDTQTEDTETATLSIAPDSDVVAAANGDGHYTLSIPANTSVTLTVVSPYGPVEPPTGTNYLNAGNMVHCVVPTPSLVTRATQHLCTGWVGTNDIPADGDTADAGPIVIETNSAITWLWATNLYLDLDVGTGGTVAPPGGWYRLGTNLDLTATPEMYYSFDAWSGDVATAAVHDTTVDVTMDAPRTVSACFLPYLATNGTAHWWLALHLGVSSNFNAAELTDADADMLLAWEEFQAGTVPTNYASALRFLQLQSTPTGVHIAWPSAAGRVYDVYRAPPPAATGTWSALASNIPAALSLTNTVVDTPQPASSVWYRVNSRWPDRP